MTDGGYQGNPEVVMPYRKPRDGSDLPEWKEELNSVHRTVRARVEHILARMKCWKILRDYRRAAHIRPILGLYRQVVLTLVLLRQNLA